MKVIKSLLSVLLAILVFLVVFDSVYLILIKYNPQVISQLKARISGEPTNPQKFLGNIVVFFLKNGKFYLKMEGERPGVVQDFVVSNPAGLKVNNRYSQSDLKSSSPSPRLESFSAVYDLKLGDQLEVTYLNNNASGPKEVSAITKVISNNFSNSSSATLAVFGIITEARSYQLTVKNNNNHGYQVTLEGSVQIGPKFNVTHSKEGDVFKPGSTKTYSNFDSLNAGQTIEVIYSKTVQETLVAESILILP